jgi:phosphatidylserine/phosphatidylglycerophosphate/cardiolipin synthase-like enzyme
VSNSAQSDSSGGGKAVFVDDEVEREILRVIRSATRYVTFVTPYVDLWMHLKDAISDARNRRVEIKFYVREGENQQRPEDLKWLRDNAKVYEIPYLHAKIYLNEAEVLVSSMNITEVSTRNSKEFAMLVRRADDASVFREYVQKLTAKSTTIQPPSMGSMVSGLIKTTVTQSFQQAVRVGSQSGVCIRCGDKIPYNPDHPFCATDYQSWAKWKNQDYKEKYCHHCGKPTKTSFERPECTSCYKLNHSN